MTFRAPRRPAFTCPVVLLSWPRAVPFEGSGGASLDAFRRRYEFDAGLDCAEISRPGQRPGRLQNPGTIPA